MPRSVDHFQVEMRTIPPQQLPQNSDHPDNDVDPKYKKHPDYAAMKRIFGADTGPLLSMNELEKAEKAAKATKAAEAKKKQKSGKLSRRPR
jgi:hypothetical protein